MSKIGIIAGGGQFPILFAKAAKEQGRQVFVAAHNGESSPEIEAIADGVCWVSLSQTLQPPVTTGKGWAQLWLLPGWQTAAKTCFR